MTITRCPNKNLPEWKMLVSQVGEEMADITYLANGQDIPNVISTPQLKKLIGFKEQKENLARISSNIKKYNRLNGTSHHFSREKLFGNTYKLTLKINYLPVNVEKARHKMASINPVYGNVDTRESFSELYPTTEYKDTYENSEFELDPNIQKVDSEGNVLHPDNIDDVDYLVSTAAAKVSGVEKKRKDKIDSEILGLKEDLKKTNDPTLTRLYQSQIEALKKLAEKSETRIKVSAQVNSYEQVLMYADSQLDEISQLLSEPSITANNILFAQKILNLWIKAGDFKTKSTDHILLDEEEFETPGIRKEFRLRRETAEDLAEKLSIITENQISNFVREYSGKDLTEEQIFKNLKDAGFLASRTLNIGRSEDPILQVIFQAIESANIKAQQEANDYWNQIDTLSKKALSKLSNLSNKRNPWRNFEQLTESGLGTGKIVHRFSDDYFTVSKQLKYNAFEKQDPKTGKLIRKKVDIENYYKWLDENTINFDVRKLFTDSQLDSESIPEESLFKSTFNESDKIKHVQELKSQLGEKGYEFYIKRVEDKLERFKLARASEWYRLNSEDLTPDEKEVQFEDWNKTNSPFWSSHMSENKDSRLKPDKKSYYTPIGLMYTYQVPRRISKSGKQTKWYDKNFEKIEADEDLLNYYNFTLETLKRMKSVLPVDKQRLMGVNDIPKMKQSLVDEFSEKGYMMGIKPFWDKLKEMSTTTDLSTIDNGYVDPLTDLREKEINIQFVEDTKQKVNALVKTKVIKYRQAHNNEDPTSEQLKTFREEARNELSQEISFDLPKIMKAYSLMALGYKHKSFIQPQIKLLEQAFKSKKEIVTNKAGQEKQKDGEILTKDGLANYNASLDYYLDSSFYSIGGRKVEGVTKKKVMTSEESKKAKELEELIAGTENEVEKKHLEEQLNNLGGFVSGSGIADVAMKYMTFKGLGWNVGSAVSNMGFGIISNINEASDGRNFNMNQMRRAYLLTTNSIGKNLSFNTLNTKPAIKIRTLMDKWDLMKTSNQELYEKSHKSSVVKGLGRFGPMSLQERSEYVNYAPIMISTMMNMKAKNSKGEQVELWEAYDENGKIKDGYSTDVDEVKLIQKIKRIIEMTHGDYNNPLLAKATVSGRALSQFRTWMFEGFANRFESEKEDFILSYGKEDPYIRKGRYRSYTQGQLTAAGATLGTTLLPGIGTAIGGAGGFLVGKFFGMQTEQSSINDVLFTLKQLARKLAFQKTQFGERFNEVDAANMRKNMTELYVLMAVVGLGLLIAAGGDDEDEEKTIAANFLINQMNRMQTDISFYTNPIEAEKLTKTAVPMAALVTDASDWFSQVGKFFNDDEDGEDDFFQSGAFKGQSKLLIQTGELIPGFAQGIRLARTSSAVIK